jgi:hypothetical protein
LYQPAKAREAVGIERREGEEEIGEIDALAVTPDLKP